MSSSKSAGLGVAESTSDSSAVALGPLQISARRWQLLTVCIGVLIVDQITKVWAVSALEDSSIDGPFGSSLRLVYNTGSAFSLGEGLGPVFGVLAIAVSVAMFWIVRHVRSRVVVLGLGLIQGGALGNVIDRLFRDGDGFLGGAVIDFLEVGGWWPVFNLADVAIVVGGALVAILGSRD
ncbi:MAG: signal peptidase II [Acidimicrobiia bacterium]|nr:signal peptidase II [Acidimicrobiia bacterium]